MKRTILTLAAAVAVSALSVSANAQYASGSRETAPATQPTAGNMPALPPGHPDMAAIMAAQPGGGGGGQQQQQQQGGMPPGHPDISTMQGGGGGGKPAGGPGAGGGMPAGHPDISSMMPGGARGPAGAPTTQPGAAVTSLSVRAVQATMGGPAIGADEVRLEVFDAHTGNVVAKVEGKLNEQGSVSIGGLPVGPAFQPVVTVVHNGVAYRAVGEPINNAQPREVTVQVYETTDRDPGWEVRMRHVMLQPTADGVQVMDIMAIDNASDRSFIGVSNADNSRVTFVMPLPAGVKDVKFLEGFDDCCTKVVDGKLVNSVAVLPGTNQYQLTYFVPMTNGKTDLIAAAPTVTKQLMILAPDDGTTVTADGAGVEAGATDMGGRKVRYFKAGGVAKDAQVKVTVTGKPTKVAGAAAAPGGAAGTTAVSPFAGADVAQLAKAVAGVGGLLIVLFGGALLFRKPMKTARTAG